MTTEQHVIVSLRAAANGFKQTEIKSAGTFKLYSDAVAVAERMNETKNRVYSHYSVIKVWR